MTVNYKTICPDISWHLVMFYLYGFPLHSGETQIWTQATSTFSIWMNSIELSANSSFKHPITWQLAYGIRVFRVLPPLFFSVYFVCFFLHWFRYLSFYLFLLHFDPENGNFISLTLFAHKHSVHVNCVLSFDCDATEMKFVIVLKRKYTHDYTIGRVLLQQQWNLFVQPLRHFIVRNKVKFKLGLTVQKLSPSAFVQQDFYPLLFAFLTSNIDFLI